MFNETIIPLLCKKSDLSYIIFSNDFKIIEFNKEIIEIADEKKSVVLGGDIREAFWEFIGIDNTTQKAIKIPMLVKNGAYYDLEIETNEINGVEKVQIAYFSKKSEFSINYTNMIQEINKKILISQINENENDKKEQEQYYNLINQKFLSFHVDLEGIITEVNNTCNYFFGIEKNEMLGRHFSNFFETRESSLDESDSKIFRAQNSDGESILFHANIIPLTKKNTIYKNVIICQDVSYLKRVEEKLAYASGHDSLTGLPNQSTILKKIDKAIQEGDSSTAFAICHIDIDNFELINDDYGHHGGEMLLKHISKLLNNLVRDCDTVARVGGDEFVILFEHIQNKKYLLATIQRIHESSKKTPLLYSEDDTISFSLNIGISSYPQDATDSFSLIKAANKQGQRNS